MPASQTDQASADRTDWAALRNLWDSEIERIASEYADNPASTDSRWAEAVVGEPSANTMVHAEFDADAVT